MAIRLASCLEHAPTLRVLLLNGIRKGETSAIDLEERIADPDWQPASVAPFVSH